MIESTDGTNGLRSRALSGLAHLVRALPYALRKHGDDRGSQLAAAIAYQVLFSLVPLVTLLCSITGLLLHDEARRDRLAAYMVDVLPLSDQAAATISRYLQDVPTPASIAGVLSIVVLFWAASGMMGAVRIGVTTAIDGRQARPYLRSKLVDFGLVLGIVLLLTLSFLLSVLAHAVAKWNSAVAAVLGPAGFGPAGAAGVLVPLLMTLGVCCLAYRYLPLSRPAWRTLLPGAVLATLASEAVKVGFSLYLATVATYDVVYGSLGSVFAFLFAVYLEAMVLVLGAEIVHAWPRTEEPGPRAEEPLLTRARRLLRAQLVTHPRQAEPPAASTAGVATPREPSPPTPPPAHPLDPPGP